MLTTGKTTTIGKYLLDRLHEMGVDHIFAVPGDYVLGFDKLIEEHEEIQFINATRENTAGYMADAYARIKGIGVACITYGVGINIVNAIAQAYVESSPVVLISGAAGIEEFSKNPIMHHLINKTSSAHSDTTQLEIFKNITIAQTILTDPFAAVDEIERVLQACLISKKPVYIEIPRDMVNQKIEEVQPIAYDSNGNGGAVLEEAVEETKRLLEQSKRPLIWAGHLLQRFGLALPMLQFAEKYNIPIVSTLLGKTVIPENHPLFSGVYQGEMSRPEIRTFVERCDFLLTLGVIMSDVDTGMFTSTIGKGKDVIAHQSSVAIGHHLYEGICLTDFIEGLTCIEINKKFTEKTPAKPKVTFTAIPGKKISTQRTFECIQQHIKPDTRVVTDMGDCLLGSIDLVLGQNAFMSNAYFASIGFGTPAAIGAQLASPNQRVIGIVGDGAFQMTAYELSTAVRYHLDPIIIVLNNHGYGTERPLLEGAYNDIVDWNYTEITKVLRSGIGIRIRYEDELDKALSTALSKRGDYYLIEVDLEKTDFSPALIRLGDLVRHRVDRRKDHSV